MIHAAMPATAPIINAASAGAQVGIGSCCVIVQPWETSQAANAAKEMPHQRLTSARSRGPTRSSNSNDGAARMGGATPNQIRRSTSVPLVPPNPKLFFIATSMRISRAWLAQ